MAEIAKEMLVTVNGGGGWLYFKVAAKTAKAGYDRLLEAFEDADIDVSNIEFGSCELRDEDGDTIDTFQVNPEQHHHYDFDLLPRLKPWDSRSGLPEHPCPRKGCLRLPDITFALYKQLGYSPSFQASRALRFIGIPIRRPEPFTKRT